MHCASTTYAALAEVDFVVERCPSIGTLQQVYQQIDGICPDHCIFGSNTSAISISRIASATQRPDRVIGLHFMNPVVLKPLVEVVRGYHTSPETIETTKRLLAAIGKEGIVVNDMPGFVSNRVLMPMINEAIGVQ
jgi:3-hydroxybutyryl-CoA dehydrogenase